MGTWHPDGEVNDAITKLLDRLCSWERATGRESTLVLIPANNDEQIVMAQSGKPYPPNFDMTPEQIVANAMVERRHNTS